MKVLVPARAFFKFYIENQICITHKSFTLKKDRAIN